MDSVRILTNSSIFRSMKLLIGGQFVRIGNERLEKMQAETPDSFSSLFRSGGEGNETEKPDG
jgi:hypothetical protein